MIDSQHQELYRIVNELYEACSEGVDQDRVDRVLERLLNYTVEHFGAEEDLMVRTAYPTAQLRSHVAMHDDLKARVGELLEERERGQLQTAMPVVELVHQWLGTHINQIDRKVAQHVNSVRQQ
jgi:hemerythrin-like metal-binding protein